MDNLVSERRRLLGGSKRRVLRQPDVDVEEVGEILREETRLQPSCGEASGEEHQQRGEEHTVAMADRPPHRASVDAGGPLLAPLFPRQALRTPAQNNVA